LRFTVEQTLDNRGDRIKEYSVALEVYERDSDFDPRLDPIVRVQAGKLRSKLDEFYAAEGQSDSLIIQYPKGGYVPVFKARELTSPHSSRCPFKRGDLPTSVPAPRWPSTTNTSWSAPPGEQPSLKIGSDFIFADASTTDCQLHRIAFVTFIL
jgi:adenylate cyclase